MALLPYYGTRVWQTMLLDKNLTQTLTSDRKVVLTANIISVSPSQQYRIWPTMPQIEIHKLLELEADMEWNSNAFGVTKQSFYNYQL